MILHSLKSSTKNYKSRIQYLRLEAGFIDTDFYPYIAQTGFTDIHKRRATSKLRLELKRKSSDLDEDSDEQGQGSDEQERKDSEKKMKPDDEC